MADRKYYVICDAGCKFESMTKEQILTAITQAMNEGTVGDIDTGFVTTIKTISGTPLRFFVGRQSEYEALSEEDKENLFAIITNDTTKDGILQKIAELESAVESTNERISATTIEGLEEVKSDVEEVKSDVADLTDDVQNIISGETSVGKATEVTATETEDLADLPVWFSAMGDDYEPTDKRAKANSFTYNPHTATLKVPYISGRATEAGEATNAIYATKATNATNATNAIYATNDSNGHNIAETYGNFAVTWKGTSILGNTAELEGAGVYLFSVYVKDAYCNFKASICMYFDGESETVGMLNVISHSYGCHAYRINITSGGTASVQRQKQDVTESQHTAEEYTNLTNDVAKNYSVIINYKKIF